MPDTAPEEDAPSPGTYATFRTFADTYMGYNSDALIADYCGAFSFVAAGDWTYASINSICIAFETTRPAKTYVRYGTTDSYGSQTLKTRERHFLHVHYLTGLTASTTYHYQLVAVDPDDETVITSADLTLDTVSGSGWVDINNTTTTLATQNKYYYLSADLTSDTFGLLITANNITIDLNGHTITYDNGTPATGMESGHVWNTYVNSATASFGIHSVNSRNNVKILNGTIKQGANNGYTTPTSANGWGFCPIYMSQYGATQNEISGVSLEWSGNDVSGMAVRDGLTYVHHNIIKDTGSVISNRTSASSQALPMGYSTTQTPYAVKCHNNLIKRGRHWVMVFYGAAYSNELWGDSWNTNAFIMEPTPKDLPLTPIDPHNIYSNKVFCTGYHSIGIGFPWSGPGGICSSQIHDNLIIEQAGAPEDRSPQHELGGSGGNATVIGLRLTQYGYATRQYTNVSYYNNYIIAKGLDGSDYVRGMEIFSDPHISGLTIHDNVIKAEQTGTPAYSCAPIFCQGFPNNGTPLPVNYYNNTIIGNYRNILFGDSYGIGGNHWFRANTITKTGSRADYHTLSVGSGNAIGNRIFDSIAGTGVDLNDNPWGVAGGNQEYSVGHSLWIIAHDKDGVVLAGVPVMVYDSSGLTFTSAVTDVNGKCRLELTEYSWAKSGAAEKAKTTRTGHYLALGIVNPHTLSAGEFATVDNETTPTVITFSPDDAPTDVTPPVVAITSPTSALTYITTSTTINISGTSSDDTAVDHVTWANSATGLSGACTGTTSWSKTGVALLFGTNVITVTSYDAAGNSNTDTLTVTRNSTLPGTGTSSRLRLRGTP
jgi:hypothetical protein